MWKWYEWPQFINYVTLGIYHFFYNTTYLFPWRYTNFSNLVINRLKYYWYRKGSLTETPSMFLPIFQGESLLTHAWNGSGIAGKVDTISFCCSYTLMPADKSILKTLHSGSVKFHLHIYIRCCQVTCPYTDSCDYNHRLSCICVTFKSNYV